MDNSIIKEELMTVMQDSDTVEFTLRRKNVKNINLRITPDSQVIVSVPVRTETDVIESFIKRKMNYIKRVINENKSISDIPDKKYVSGESFRIEGKYLRLKVTEADKNSIASDGIFLYLNVKDNSDTVSKEKLVRGFYTEKKKTIAGEILDKYYEIFRKYNVSKPVIRFKNMKTRWGSCSADGGTITLNSRLIEAPRNCIEYVIMHELCHLVHHNHSKEFYSFLSMQMPDWKERKVLLDNIFYS